jgi:hypothetical protein
VHQSLIKQAARANNQQQRNQAAENDHAVARKQSHRLEESDVDDDPEQRS